MTVGIYTVGIVGKMGPLVIVFWTVAVVAGLPRPIYKEYVKKMKPVEEINIIFEKGEKISVDGFNDVKLGRNVSLCQNTGEKYYESVPGTRKIDAIEASTIAEEEDEENDGRKRRRGRKQEEETERNWKKEETSVAGDARRRRANELVDVRFFGMPIGVVDDLAKINVKDKVNEPKGQEIVKNVENRFKTTKLSESEGNFGSSQENTRLKVIEDQNGSKKEDERTTKSDFKIEKEEASRKSLKNNNGRSGKSEDKAEEGKENTTTMMTMTKNEETSESNVEDGSTTLTNVDERRRNDNSSEIVDQKLKSETKESEVENKEEEPVVIVAGRMFDETMKRPEESEVVEDEKTEKNEDRSTIIKSNRKELEERLKSEEDREDESNIEELQKTNYNVVVSSKISNEEKTSSKEPKIESQGEKKKEKKRKMEDQWNNFHTSHCRVMANEVKSSISLISSNTKDDERNEDNKYSYKTERVYGRHRKKSKRHSRGETSKKLCKLQENGLTILRDFAQKCKQIMGQCELIIRGNREDEEDDDDDDVERKLLETKEDKSTKSILFSIASEIAIEIQPVIQFYEDTDEESTSISTLIESKVTETTDNPNSSHPIG